MSAPSKVRPKVDLDATGERLVRLVLDYGAEHLADCLVHSAKADLPTHAFLDRLLVVEITERNDRVVVELIRRSAHCARHETPVGRRRVTPLRHRKEGPCSTVAKRQPDSSQQR